MKQIKILLWKFGLYPEIKILLWKFGYYPEYRCPVCGGTLKSDAYYERMPVQFWCPDKECEFND